MISFKQFFLQESVEDIKDPYYRRASSHFKTGALRTDKNGIIKNTGINMVPGYKKIGDPNHVEHIPVGKITPKQAFDFSLKYKINLNKLKNNVPVQLGNKKLNGKAVKLVKRGSQHFIVHV